MKKEDRVLVLVGNDKRGRAFLAQESRNYDVRFAVSIGSHSIRRIVKLLRRGSLSLPVLVKMTWAEIRRPFHRIPALASIKTNSDLLQLIQAQHIDQVILFHVGMIIRRKVLETGVTVYNIHCARLPEYGGLMAIQRALDKGDFQQEATLHIINEQVDSGETVQTIPFLLDAEKSYGANEDTAFDAGEALLRGFLQEYRISQEHATGREMKKQDSNSDYYASHWQIFQKEDVPQTKLDGAQHFFSPVMKELQENNISILDAGCGDGVHWRYLRSLPKQNFTYCGIDVADSAIAHLQKQTVNKNDSFKVMNLNKLDLPDNAFDVVFAFGVLGYCDDPFASFKELCRVCKPGGMIGLYSPEIGGMKKLFFQTLRAFCKGMNLEQKRRVAKLIIPIYGLLPSNSKMSTQNADKLQLEEVIMTNIAPPQLTFIPNAEIQNWYRAQGIEITSDSELEKTSIWGRKKED